MKEANLNDKFAFINELNVNEEVSKKLTSYMHILDKGNKTVLMTPIAKDNDPDKLLKLWDEIFESKSKIINEPLYNLEMLNRSKFGPRSIAKSWSERKSDVYNYFKDNKTSKIDQRKLLELSDHSRSLRPLSINKAVKHLKNQTSSGLPFMTKKVNIKSELVKDFDNILNRKDPAILFTRTQEGNKTRTVWGYPAADTLLEMRYYRPLLDIQSQVEWRKALKGPKHVDKYMERLVYLCNSVKDYYLLSVDFSAYDASVSKDLIDAAFYYIKAKFQMSSSEDLNYIRDRFNSIGILTPDGVINGNHGVPSGSTFTNEVDSIVQYLTAMSVLKDDDYLGFQIQGDDGVYAIEESAYDKLIDRFESVGLNVNKEKSYFEKNWAVYLQNLYHPDYPLASNQFGGVYPSYRALNRILFQERFTNLEEIGLKGEDYFSIRAISILENCKYHPLFEDLVKFIFSLDKYKLGFSQDGLLKYSEHIKQTEGAGDIVVNQYGDELSGFNNFETVKLIRKFNNL